MCDYTCTSTPVIEVCRITKINSLFSEQYTRHSTVNSVLYNIYYIYLSLFYRVLYSRSTVHSILYSIQYTVVFTKQSSFVLRHDTVLYLVDLLYSTVD